MNRFNKIIALALCLILMLSSFSVGAFAEEVESEPQFILGDVDGDGVIETEDARALLRLASRLEVITDELLEKGDMDADGAITVNDAILALRAAVSIGGVVIPDKNGENILDDSPDNEFIQLIANEYDLDPRSLVAIYSTAEDGTNFVLRFGRKNDYEKSVDNLSYVYQIGPAPDREISYTNGKMVLGDHHNVDYGTGMLIFNIVQTMVMPQYPDYFIGV